MTTRLPFICLGCRHFNYDVPLTCTAFPTGIPSEIQSGDNDHREHFAGDHGIQFDQDPQKESIVESYYRYKGLQEESRA